MCNLINTHAYTHTHTHTHVYRSLFFVSTTTIDPPLVGENMSSLDGLYHGMAELPGCVNFVNTCALGQPSGAPRQYSVVFSPSCTV